MKGSVLKSKSSGMYVMAIDVDMDIVVGVAYTSCIERAMFIDFEAKVAVEEEFSGAVEDLELEVIAVERLTKEIR